LIVILKTTFDDVTEANIKKLFKRRDEGVLKGDGDNRTGGANGGFIPVPPYRIQNSYQDSGWEESGHEYLSLTDAIRKGEECASDSICWGMVRIIDADNQVIKTFGAGETSRKAA
jgi:hypothetical protein